MSGYFAIPRDLYESIKIEHSLSGYQTTVAVLCELGARVRYNGNIGNNLEIGQCFLGKTEVADLLGTTRDRVRGALNILKRIHAISTVETHKGTTVTILDKRIYTSNGKYDPREANNESTLTDSTTTTTKEPVHGKLKQEDLERLSLAYNASMPEMLVEVRAMEEWLSDPKKNKSGRVMNFRFASNWMKRWEARPKPNAEIEAIKLEMFKPHPTQKNWE